MKNEVDNTLNDYLSNYKDDTLIINLVELWSTISTRPPQGSQSIKDAIIGQIFGGLLKYYSIQKVKKESELSEAELEYLKKLFESRYIEIQNYVESIMGRYHAY